MTLENPSRGIDVISSEPQVQIADAALRWELDWHSDWHSRLCQSDSLSEHKKPKGLREADQKRAEREGFEPSVGFHQHRFSRPAQSATLSPLRGVDQRIIESAPLPEKMTLRAARVRARTCSCACFLLQKN